MKFVIINIMVTTSEIDDIVIVISLMEFNLGAIAIFLQMASGYTMNDLT